ncbi:MAG: hypothetical protein QOF61_1232 [Acidobacteriota bacterium]|nr:hypothetical protein [Acidobacteriota bacterium]
MKRVALFFKRVALLCVAVLLALVVVEIALRVFHPSYNVAIPWSYEYDPELAFRLKPEAHLFRMTDFQQETVTNRAGTSNFQESFEDYPQLVFTLGDSFTQGIGVPADASYPFQLDAILNRDEQGFYVKRYGVVNLGVSGFGGEQNLIALSRYETRLGAPSVILYLGCDNDLTDDLMFRGGYRHTQLTEGNPYWGRLVVPLRWLTENLQIGVQAKTFMLGRRRERAREQFEARAGAEGKMPSAAESEATVLARLVADARAHGARLVVSWSDANPSYYWLKGWAARSGVAFADWAPRAASVTAAMPALPLDNTHSGGHHRAWTNRVIAEEFARQMRVAK